MQKAILISIQPQHALNILTGKKTLELRKSVPKGFKGWVYLHVTKGKPYLNKEDVQGYFLVNGVEYMGYKVLNGSIVARFWFDEYDTYTDYSGCTNNENGYECENEYLYQLCELPNKLKELCLTCDEVENYGNGKDLYAWHIKKLEIFDKQMELGEFYRNIKSWTTKRVRYKKYGYELKTEHVKTKDTQGEKLTKAPQSYQYVWVRE